MSQMSDETAKREVKIQLERAQEALKTALLFPKGMSVVDFHDVHSMVELLEEIKNGTN